MHSECTMLAAYGLGLSGREVVQIKVTQSTLSRGKHGTKAGHVASFQECLRHGPHQLVAHVSKKPGL